ncbi:MAG: glutamine amidotransferase-related protein, partial [Gammaproteobacteria bacterium]
LNTGLTLRTVRVSNGIAEVRAGATLLFESDPQAEEAETRLKASALLDAIMRADTEAGPQAAQIPSRAGAGRKVLMVDHEDSFVHTLAGYFRETGAEVVTYRSGFSAERLEAEQPDLVLLSPGPGHPQDFDLSRTIDAALTLGVPIFGVCLGLQGIVEYFGGELATLSTPMHGKPSSVRVLGGRVFDGLPEQFTAGRYHSLYASSDCIPESLEVIAQTHDGVVMGVQHRELPIAAVQFHPESIMSLNDDCGQRLVANVMRLMATG